MFLTTVDSFTGNVIASFSSKMFKSVEGKRQSFALILLKKLGFIVGFKTLIKRCFDLQVVFSKRLRRSVYVLYFEVYINLVLSFVDF